MKMKILVYNKLLLQCFIFFKFMFDNDSEVLDAFQIYVLVFFFSSRESVASLSDQGTSLLPTVQ